MKNVLTLLIIGLFFTAFAYTAEAHHGEEIRGTSSAGITPGNPLYIIDRLSETLRSLFTFDKIKKARLQITFAAERIAEISVILETKGVEARGINTAQKHLEKNLARATSIIIDQEEAGNDLSDLIDELNDIFESSRDILLDDFREALRMLKDEEKELKNKILDIRREGGEVSDLLLAELADLKREKKILKEERDIIKEEDRLESLLEEEKEAAKKIAKAIKEKEELIEEAEEENITLSPEDFKDFDAQLLLAQEALKDKNYEGAKKYAQQARKILKSIESLIEETEKHREIVARAKEKADDVQEFFDKNQRKIDELKKEAKNGASMPRFEDIFDKEVVRIVRKNFEKEYEKELRNLQELDKLLEKLLEDNFKERDDRGSRDEKVKEDDKEKDDDGNNDDDEKDN